MRCFLFGHQPVLFTRVGVDAVEYDTAELRDLMRQLGRPERPASIFVEYWRCSRCGMRRQSQTNHPGFTAWWKPEGDRA